MFFFDIGARFRIVFLHSLYILSGPKQIYLSALLLPPKFTRLFIQDKIYRDIAGRNRGGPGPLTDQIDIYCGLAFIALHVLCVGEDQVGLCQTKYIMVPDRTASVANFILIILSAIVGITFLQPFCGPRS